MTIGSEITGPGLGHSYAALGSAYFRPTEPTPVAAPRWIAFNDELAMELGLPEHWQKSADTLAALAGNQCLEGMQPGATVYAGHQFGSYNPQLGDGRALLLGEWQRADGQHFDIQLKGAGMTPFSRGGDGRSPIGPVVREYLLSEAMHALGVPTTRALAAVATGEPVYRQRPEPGGILTRVASSHLRIGTVQFFAMTQRGEGLPELVDYAAKRHYPSALERAAGEQPEATAAAVLLDAVMRSLVRLVVDWQCLGFIHGVLNTDNMLLCGETVDYGPCAFMDAFSGNRVFSSIDQGGRYAFNNQPGIVHWNLSVLAQCLLPLIDPDQDTAVETAQRIIDNFPRLFGELYAARLAAKFGLDAMQEADRPLVDAFFAQLEADQLDFTLAFRWLTEIAGNNVANTPLPDLFTPSSGLNTWLSQWQQRRQGASEQATSLMASANPAVIPRNHLVAQAIAAAEQGDYDLLERLQARWRAPWQWQGDDMVYAAAPREDEQVHRTFCGT